jgi:hypothetical protein
MAACLGMCLLGPLAAWLSVVTGGLAIDLINLGPIMAVRTLGGAGATTPTSEQWGWIALLGLAGVATWAALGMMAVWRRLPSGHGPQSAI